MSKSDNGCATSVVYGPYPHRGRWRIEIVDQAGIKTRQSFATKHDAANALVLVKTSIQATEIPDTMAEAMLAQAIRVDEDSAWVYFLKDAAGAVLYVGVSLQVVPRSQSHRADGVEFADVYMVPMPMPRSLALRLEAALVRTMNPPLNRNLKGTPTEERGTRGGPAIPPAENTTGPVAAEPVSNTRDDSGNAACDRGDSNSHGVTH